MKSLNGAEIADYMKANQAAWTRRLRAQGVAPKLVIIRDNASPVIQKYVSLKKAYGQDIGVEVEDWLRNDLAAAVDEANNDTSVHGMIVQLPLVDKTLTDAVVNRIIPGKDVDGLATLYHQMNNAKMPNSPHEIKFESATATAINWLLAGYDIDLSTRRIAIVGHGRLVGAPLERMWRDSGYDVTVFNSKSDLTELSDFDVIVTATGVPHLIKGSMVKTGAVVVDAGTASEDGVLKGDIDDDVRAHTDLLAITPKVGGVGPLTVTALFEHVLMAAEG